MSLFEKYSLLLLLVKNNRLLRADDAFFPVSVCVDFEKIFLKPLSQGIPMATTGKGGGDIG